MRRTSRLPRVRWPAFAFCVPGLCLCLFLSGCATLVQPPAEPPRVLRLEKGAAKIRTLPAEPLAQEVIQEQYRRLLQEPTAKHELTVEVEEVSGTGDRLAVGAQLLLLPIDMICLGFWGFTFPDRYEAEYRVNLRVVDPLTQETWTLPGVTHRAEAELRGFLGWRLLLWGRMQRKVQARAKLNALHRRMHDLDRDLAGLGAPAQPAPPLPTASAITDETGQGPVKKRWAVVIGVSKYKDRRIPALRYAAADARAFYQWLTSPAGGGYNPANVKLLLDEQATYGNVRNALYEWIRGAIAEDLVVVYFAGHGSPPSPDEPENLFLLTYDSDYERIASTGFPMWDIRGAIEKFVRARKVVVLADACHAAGIGKEFDVSRRAGRAIDVAPVAARLESLGQIRDGIAVLMASDERQFSQEDERWGGGHGVFTHFLLEGLQGQADGNSDQRVTITELATYVSEQVRRATRSAQSPKMAGAFDPQLTLAR